MQKELSMSDFRQLKASWKESIRNGRWKDVLRAAMALPGREAVGPLISLLPQTPEIKWRGVAIFGQVLAQLADRDLENARVVMRQLMWQLNEESGNLGWGIPEAFGSALACTAAYAAEDHPPRDTILDIFENEQSPAGGIAGKQEQHPPPKPTPPKPVARKAPTATKLTQRLGTRLSSRLAAPLAPRLASRVAPKLAPRVAARLASRLDQRKAPGLSPSTAPSLAAEYSRILHSYIRDTGREDNFCEHGPMRRGAFWAVARFAAAYPDLAVPMFDSMLAGLRDEEATCRGMAAWGVKIFNARLDLSQDQKLAARKALEQLANSEDPTDRHSLDLLEGANWDVIREATVRELAGESLAELSR